MELEFESLQKFVVCVQFFLHYRPPMPRIKSFARKSNLTEISTKLQLFQALLHSLGRRWSPEAANNMAIRKNEKLLN